MVKVQISEVDASPAPFSLARQCITLMMEAVCTSKTDTLKQQSIEKGEN
jgi:hypothetical protein